MDTKQSQKLDQARHNRLDAWEAFHIARKAYRVAEENLDKARETYRKLESWDRGENE